MRLARVPQEAPRTYWQFPGRTSNRHLLMLECLNRDVTLDRLWVLLVVQFQLRWTHHWYHDDLHWQVNLHVKHHQHLCHSQRKCQLGNHEFSTILSKVFTSPTHATAFWQECCGIGCPWWAPKLELVKVGFELACLELQKMIIIKFQNRQFKELIQNRR